MRDRNRTNIDICIYWKNEEKNIVNQFLEYTANRLFTYHHHRSLYQQKLCDSHCLLELILKQST